MGTGVTFVPSSKVSMVRSAPGFTLNFKVTIRTAGLQAEPSITLLEGVELTATAFVPKILA